MSAMSATTAVAVVVAVLGGAWLARIVTNQMARALVVGRLPRRRSRFRWRPPFSMPAVLWPAGRHERRYGHTLPLALDAVARSLRAGHSLRRALADAGAATSGAVVGDLLDVVATADAGRPLTVALDRWAERRPRPDVLLVVAALGLAADTGAASAHAVEGVASTLRRRLAATAEAHSLGAQARASAVVLVAAPVAMAGVSLVSGGAAAGFLLGTPAGIACLVGGLVLDGAGGYWMARLTRGVGR
jgi:tight adherence protein B